MLARSSELKAVIVAVSSFEVVVAFIVPSSRLKPPPEGGQISSASVGRWHTDLAATWFSTSSITHAPKIGQGLVAVP